MMLTETTADSLLADVAQSILREQLADPAARLSDLDVEPLASGGFSGNRLYRARLCWTGPRTGPGAATWVIKRWLPGGLGERLLGVDRPLEALGWEAGLLRPSRHPPGVRTPIVGTWRDPGERGAWIAMEDVSDALGRYSREAPLQPAEAVARARLVLDGLARWHVWWEHPAQQARLAAYHWLVPAERFLWCEAASCAAALGKPSPPGVAPGSAVTDEYRAAVAAVLAWLPAGDRAWFERLLHRREPLVSALRPLPRTLLHGDLDDRNIGLRPFDPRHLADLRCLVGPSASGNPDAPPIADLVLIDWEWIGLGTPALDVARVWASFPAVCDPSQPCPEATFSGELPDYYLDRYRAHGGRSIDPRSWRRACALGMLAGALSQVSFIGAMLRDDVKPVVATLGRQLEIVIEAARSLPAA